MARIQDFCITCSDASVRAMEASNSKNLDAARRKDITDGIDEVLAHEGYESFEHEWEDMEVEFKHVGQPAEKGTAKALVYRFEPEVTRSDLEPAKERLVLAFHSNSRAQVDGPWEVRRKGQKAYRALRVTFF